MLKIKLYLLSIFIFFSFFLHMPTPEARVIMEKGENQAFGIGEEAYQSPFTKDSEGNRITRSPKREKKEEDYNYYPLIISPEIKWDSSPSGTFPGQTLPWQGSPGQVFPKSNLPEQSIPSQKK